MITRQLTNSAIPIRSSQVGLVAGVLTEAFHDNAGATYIFPDPDIRRAALSWFFNSVAIRLGRLCGEVHTTVDVDGGALWIRPGVQLTVAHAMKIELLSLPFGIDRLSIARWSHVSGYLEAVRRNLIDTPHWYLIALGTQPSKKKPVNVGTLLEPVLAEADWDLRSCYVETFDANDLPCFRQLGFEIAGAGQIPRGGPSFWTLIRPPRPPLRNVRFLGPT